MWGFIATEVLFLGGLFAAYSFFRYLHPAGVAAAASHTKIVIGSVNTAVLLTSSLLCVGVARRSGRREPPHRPADVGCCRARNRLPLPKGYRIRRGDRGASVAGSDFFLDITEKRIGEIFYFFYWLMTGIHALHLLVGIGALAVIGRRAVVGKYRASITARFASSASMGISWMLSGSSCSR